MSQKITSLDEFNEIINNGQTVIAFFGATWLVKKVKNVFYF